MDETIKQMTCIICPKGCQMMVQMDVESECLKVIGNGCEKGALYANEELLHPVRTLTTTLKTNNPMHPRISVKTSGPIHKEKIMSAMRSLDQINVELPVEIGDVLVENLLNLNVDVIATMTLKDTE
ncbi:DUF1667 domain-containing protein [Fusibacter bizertensis]